MADWQLWFLAAVGLLIAEMFTGGFWLFCVALACAVAGVLGLFPFAGPLSQLGAFTVAGLISMFAVRPTLTRHLQGRSEA